MKATMITISKFNGHLLHIQIADKIIRYVQNSECVVTKLNRKQQTYAVPKSYRTKKNTAGKVAFTFLS